MRYLFLSLAAASLTFSACTNTSSSKKPSYNNTQTSTTTTTGNEEIPPPPATRSAQHSGHAAVSAGFSNSVPARTPRAEARRGVSCVLG